MEGICSKSNCCKKKLFFYVLLSTLVQSLDLLKLKLDFQNWPGLEKKTDFCICENKDADQLRGNQEIDQRLCFRYIDNTIPPLPKSEISSLCLYSLVCVGPGRKLRKRVFS